MGSISEEYCPAQEDEIHCVCWWDGEPCCSCGNNDAVKEENERIA